MYARGMSTRAISDYIQGLMLGFLLVLVKPYPNAFLKFDK